MTLSWHTFDGLFTRICPEKTIIEIQIFDEEPIPTRLLSWQERGREIVEEQTNEMRERRERKKIENYNENKQCARTIRQIGS